MGDLWFLPAFAIHECTSLHLAVRGHKITPSPNVSKWCPFWPDLARMESPQNSDPDRFRIRFREPQDLMTVRAEEVAGAAVRIHTRQRTPHTRRPIRGCTFLRSLSNH